MDITLRSHNRRTSRKIERDFQWYDTVNKRMLMGRGGEMRFRYIPAQKRAIPYLVDSEVPSYQNDYDHLTSWIQKNTSRFDIVVVDSARKSFVMIRVPISQFDDVTESLYQSKIAFDYDEKELHREIEEQRRQ